MFKFTEVPLHSEAAQKEAKRRFLGVPSIDVVPDSPLMQNITGGKQVVLISSAELSQEIVAFSVQVIDGSNKPTFQTFVRIYISNELEEAASNWETISLTQPSAKPQFVLGTVSRPENEVATEFIFVVFTVEGNLSVFSLSQQRKGGYALDKLRGKDTLSEKAIWASFDKTTNVISFFSRIPPASQERNGAGALQALVTTGILKNVKISAKRKYEVLSQFTIPDVVPQPDNDVDDYSAEHLSLDINQAPGDKKHIKDMLFTCSNVSLTGIPNASFLEVDGVPCFCVQRPYTKDMASGDVSVPVTLFNLANQIRIDISFVLPKNIPSVRVLFDSVCNTLAVFVPGVFVYIADMQTSHNPLPGFFTSDSASILSSSSSSVSSSSSLLSQAPHSGDSSAADKEQEVPSKPVPPPVLVIVKNSQQGRNQIFDKTSGKLFDYTFRELFFRNEIEKTKDISIICTLLHIMFIHIKNKSQNESILHKLISGKPNVMRAPVVKELAVAMIYNDIQQKIPAYILDGLPCTCMDQTDVVLPDNPAVSEFSLETIIQNQSSYSLKKYWKYVQVPNPSFARKHPEIKEAAREPGNRFMLFLSSSQFSSLFRDTSSQTPSSTKSYNQLLLKTIQASLQSTYPSLVPQNANKYTRDLLDSQDVVFNSISGLCYHYCSSGINRTPECSSYVYFTLMETLLAVASELGCSLPMSFYTDYWCFSLSCLPRILILQYLDRGLLIPTPAIIKSAIAQDLPSKDPDLFYRMLCHVPENVSLAAFDLVPKKPPFYIVDSFLSRNPILLVKKPLTPPADTDFLPLSTLLMSMTDNKPIDEESVRELWPIPYPHVAMRALTEATDQKAAMERITLPDEF